MDYKNQYIRKNRQGLENVMENYCTKLRKYVENLEDGNQARLGILKKVALKELSLFAVIYQNDEYEKLQKQIVEMY